MRKNTESFVGEKHLEEREIFVRSIENTIKNALFSFPAKIVSRGPAPLDAPAGSVYYSVEKVLYGSDAYSATVKIRYFPDGTPTSHNGEDIFGFIDKVEPYGVMYNAKKYECRVYGHYVEVTVEYSFDSEAFTGIIDMNGTDSGYDEEELSGGILMKSITITIDTEVET